MRDGQCPKCGSADVIPNAYVLPGVPDSSARYWENLRVVVVEKPDAWFFKGEVFTSLKAWVCGACGYTELYAKNAPALLAAWRKHEEQS